MKKRETSFNKVKLYYKDFIWILILHNVLLLKTTTTKTIFLPNKKVEDWIFDNFQRLLLTLYS